MSPLDPPGMNSEDAHVVLPRRHPFRWVAAVIILLLVAAAVRSIASNPRIEWDVVGQYFLSTRVLQGLWATIWLTVVGMSIGIALGIVFAAMRMSPNIVLASVANAYIWFFRGTPLLVQLIFLFNFSALYPRVGLGSLDLPVNDILTPTLVAIIGLSLNEAAYMAEIVRAGVQSVPHGQTEAAQALGFTKSHLFRRIVLPQTMKVIIPPTANELINVLKATSLLSVIAMPELLFSVQLIYSQTFQTIPLLVVATLWYLIVTTVLMVVQSKLEARFSRGSRAGGRPRNVKPVSREVLEGA